MRSQRVHIYIIIVWLISSAVPAFVQDIPIVATVTIYGNIRYSDDALLDAIDLKTGKQLPAGWPEYKVISFQNWYRSQGYFFMQVDSIQTYLHTDRSKVDILIWINEGRAVYFGNLELNGIDDEFKDTFWNHMEFRSGRLFREAVLADDIESILSYLEDHGYPLAEVRIDSIMFRQQEDKHLLNVGLYIETGPLVRLGSFTVIGNDLTQERVILRELRIRTGEPYRQKEISGIREILQRMDFFQTVDEPEVRFIKDKAFIVLKIKEGNTNTLDGVLGYNPKGQDGGNGYFTGRLEFTFRNLFGTGRFLEAYWEKKDEQSQAMRFGYEEPWLLGWPLHLGGRFRQEIRDTTYIEREWLFSLRYAPWSNLSVSMEAGQKQILPDSLGSFRYDLARTKSWVFALGIDYHTMDDPVNPRKGVRYQAQVTWGIKRNLGPDFLLVQEAWKQRVDTRSIKAEVEAVVPVFRRQVLYLGVHGVEIKTGDPFVPISDQVRFGGANSLRGYAEDQFRGSLAAWFNSEYRFLTGRRSRLFFFVDGGVYQREEKESGTVRGYKIGYGLGIRMETRLGIIGVDYGIGEDDNLLRGKVHVGIMSRF